VAQPYTGPRAETGGPSSPTGAAAGHRPIPTVYRLPWLLLGFAPWYLKHLFAQSYRRLSLWGNLRELFTHLKRRHRIALYDGVMNLILNGYSALAGVSLRRTSGQIAVVIARLAFAFDDEHERRCVSGESLAFEDVFAGSQVQDALHDWRDFMRQFPEYPAIRDYLNGFVRSLYAAYTADGHPPSATADFRQLVRAATLDSGGFLMTVVQVVALSQGTELADSARDQFSSVGVLGKAADDMIDFRADAAAGRPNLLGALVAETPSEHAVVRDASAQGVRMNTVWWRKQCPATFATYLAECAELYATLDTRWLRFASHLMWIPALLGRSTTTDVRGRL
jgi:hypothetical protein